MSYITEVLADSPVAWWRLGAADVSSGGAHDEIGTNHGLYAGALSGQPGAIVGDADTSAQFLGGSSTKITCATSALNFSGVAPFSVECWVKRNTTNQTFYRGLVDKYVAGGDGWLLYMQASSGPQPHRAYFSRRVGAVEVSAQAVTQNPTGAFQHIVATYSGTNLRIYIDGALEATTADVRSIVTTGAPLLIGGGPGTTAGFGGFIDEVAVYDYALSAGRVTAHFLSGTNVVPSNLSAPEASGVLAIGATLSCTTGSWSNTPLSYAYQWLRDGTPISGETASTYTLAVEDIGTMLSCTVVATNANGSSGPVESNTLDASGVSPPLTGDYLFVEYSGGAANTNPLGSIGGEAGEALELPAGSQAVFDRILGSVAVGGQTDYRLLYVHNTHPTLNVEVVAYIAQQIVSDFLSLMIGAATQAVDVTVPALVDRFTAPADVTFSAPTDIGSGVTLGIIPAGGRKGLWIERVDLAGASFAPTNPGQIGLLITEVA